MIGMHAIRKKLQSRRGASLTFALLLFLVCAVVGSVVLAAGFAAAGRLAELGESEQRFYAVNSAAELMLEQLCGDANEITVGIKREPTETGFKYTNTLPPSEKQGTLAADLATYIVYGSLGIATNGTEDQFKVCADEAGFYKTKTFQYEFSADDIPTVLVTAKFINGYQLNLTVHNKVESGKASKVYTLPTIILETDSPRGMNDTDTYEYTFNWKTPKG